MDFALATTDTTDDLEGIAKYAVEFMDTLGAVGAGILIALENIFPPLPSEVILPLAGFTAQQGGFPLWAALSATTLGSVVGALVLYWFGAAFGIDRIKAIFNRIPLLHSSDVDKAVGWFEVHGTKAVFFGRMLPVFRSLISIPAGLNRMPLPKFIALTAIGSMLWNTVFIMAGYWLGAEWHLVAPYAETLQLIVIGVVVIAAAGFIAFRLRNPVREAAV